MGFGVKKEAINVIVFGMIAVIFGFTKLPGLTSKTSNVFCWERLISLLRGYLISVTAQNWLPFFLMGFLNSRCLEVWDPSVYLTFDSLVSPGSKSALGILILPERLTWIPEPLSISRSHILACSHSYSRFILFLVLFKTFRIIFKQ